MNATAQTVATSTQHTTSYTEYQAAATVAIFRVFFFLPRSRSLYTNNILNSEQIWRARNIAHSLAIFYFPYPNASSIHISIVGDFFMYNFVFVIHFLICVVVLKLLARRYFIEAFGIVARITLQNSWGVSTRAKRLWFRFALKILLHKGMWKENKRNLPCPEQRTKGLIIFSENKLEGRKLTN